MQNLTSIEGILNFAINNEIAAHDFYIELASKVTNPLMKGLLKGFAEEEDGHRKKLEMIKEGQVNFPKPDIKKITDMKLADYTVEVEPMADTSYQGALVLAMKKEKAAFKMYTDLAALAGDQKIKELFLQLAQEEAVHKMRFEIEYDNEIYKEN